MVAKNTKQKIMSAASTNNNNNNAVAAPETGGGNGINGGTDSGGGSSSGGSGGNDSGNGQQQQSLPPSPQPMSTTTGIHGTEEDEGGQDSFSPVLTSSPAATTPDADTGGSASETNHAMGVIVVSEQKPGDETTFMNTSSSSSCSSEDDADTIKMKADLNKLPYLDETEFLRFINKVGPMSLRQLQRNYGCPSEIIKRVILRIARTHNLFSYLEVYLNQFAMYESTLATEIYDLGFGHYIVQNKIQDDVYNRIYVVSGNVFALAQSLCNVLPSIESGHNYLSGNLDFWTFDEGASIIKVSKQSPIPWHPKIIYLKKLESGLACYQMSRFAEAWAHLLSALDLKQQDYPLQHVLFSCLASVAVKLHLAHQIPLMILKEASLMQNSFEQKWRRFLVFQEYLIGQGLFVLENKVFMHATKDIVRDSYYGYWIGRNHLEGMFMQIEDNLAFQFARFMYHKDCLPECGKPFLLPFNMTHAIDKLDRLQGLIVHMKSIGERDYYWGLYHFIRAIISMGFNCIGANSFPVVTSTFENSNENNFAEVESNLFRQYFSLAQKTLHFYDVRRICASNLMCLAKHTVYPIRGAKTEMNSHTLWPHSEDKANLLFRVSLFALFWSNRFTLHQIKRYLGEALTTYSLATNKAGYRCYIIESLLSSLTESCRHKNQPRISDFPDQMTCFHNEKKGVRRKADQHWEYELRREAGPPSKRCKLVGLTPGKLLSECKQAKKAYAFGYNIVESRITPVQDIPVAVPQNLQHTV